MQSWHLEKNVVRWGRAQTHNRQLTPESSWDDIVVSGWGGEGRSGTYPQTFGLTEGQHSLGTNSRYYVPLKGGLNLHCIRLQCSRLD